MRTLKEEIQFLKLNLHSKIIEKSPHPAGLHRYQGQKFSPLPFVNAGRNFITPVGIKMSLFLLYMYI